MCVGYDVTSPTCRSRGAVLVVEPGIGKAALRAITADRHRGHPMETRGHRSPRKERPVEKGKVCTPSNSITLLKLRTVQMPTPMERN